MVEMDLGSLDIQTVTVTMSGRTFLLQEIGETDFALYQSAILNLAKIDKTEASLTKESLSGFADLDSLLVSLCLSEGGVRIPVETIKTWPHRVVDKLTKKAKDISGMNDKADKLKNEPSATGESSK